MIEYDNSPLNMSLLDLENLFKTFHHVLRIIIAQVLLGEYDKGHTKRNQKCNVLFEKEKEKEKKIGKARVEKAFP